MKMRATLKDGTAIGVDYTDFGPRHGSWNSQFDFTIGSDRIRKVIRIDRIQVDHRGTEWREAEELVALAQYGIVSLERVAA